MALPLKQNNAHNVENTLYGDTKSRLIMTANTFIKVLYSNIDHCMVSQTSQQRDKKDPGSLPIYFTRYDLFILFYLFIYLFLFKT